MLTLDPSKQIDVPGGNAGALKVPSGRLALLIEVKDDKFFNKLDALLGFIPGVVKTDEPGLKMRTMSYPVAANFEARPTLARWDKFLVIASDDHLVRDMVAVHKGGAGFKASPAFAKVSAGLPTQGNSFTLVTRTLMENLRNVQKQALASQSGGPSAQNEWLAKFLLSDAVADSYTVSGHVENGWLTVNKGPSGVGKILGPLAVMPAAMAAGMALPAFGKVSAKGKASSSLLQAKQIAIACKMYAGDHDGKFPPTLDALVPAYLPERKVFVSPFAPDEPMGYTYHPGLTEKSPSETVLVEDRYSIGVAGQRVTIHADTTGEVTKATEE